MKERIDAARWYYDQLAYKDAEIEQLSAELGHSRKLCQIWIDKSDAQNERLSNIIRATEVERDAADKVANNLRTEIEQLKDRVKWLTVGISVKDNVISELQKAPK